MKKFLIEMEIITQQKVVYQVEADSREQLDKDLKDWTPFDIGECVQEYAQEYHHMEITDITEKIEK